ncbi:MAG: helix-turn-helix transcriptional regulator [Saprospiraceae bacterium]
MKIVKPFTTLQRLLKDLAKTTQVELEKDCHEYNFAIPKEIGDGYIYGLTFQDGLNLLIVDCMLEEDLDLVLEASQKPQYLALVFAVEGGLRHEYSYGQVAYQLNPLQGAITANPMGSYQEYQIPGKVKMLFTILLIDREKYLKKVDCYIEKMPDQLSTVFKDKESAKHFISQNNYSISISECIKKMTSNEYEGLVRSTFLESKTLELLSLQIKQFKDDLLTPSKQVLLRKYDLDKIKAAKEILVTQLQDPPKIPQLARKVGINQQKLKQGFKAVYSKTINQYLRDERLAKARILLAEGSLSVREVSTQIGYSNQGHFARRFKEKYGVLPKDYLKNLQTVIIDNQ